VHSVVILKKFDTSRFAVLSTTSENVQDV